MPRTLTFLGLALGLLLGLAASTPAVYLNGARTTEVVVVQGKVYVALEALQKSWGRGEPPARRLVGAVHPRGGEAPGRGGGGTAGRVGEQRGLAGAGLGGGPRP